MKESKIEIIKRSFDGMSLAEAVGKEKRILITENHKWILSALLDTSTNECTQFMVKLSEPDFNDLTSLHEQIYQTDQFRAAVESIQK